MKNLFILLIALFCVNICIAQKDYDPIYGAPKNKKVDTQGFKISNGKLIWQKVYECKDSINQIVSNLKRGGILKGIEISDGTVTGSLKNIDSDYKGAGFSRGLTPMYLISDRLTCFVLIEFKKEKYRVTIKNMQLINVLESPINKIGESEPIESYALKKKNTAFKDTFLKDAATILNYTFNKIFDTNKNSENDDNW